MFFYTYSFFVAVLPPVWFLRIVTHLHCSTLANLLLDPNTVLGPINLHKGRKCLVQNKVVLVYSKTCVNLQNGQHEPYFQIFMCTYAALFHTMTSLSSPPDARYSPLLDQRTQFTHAAGTQRQNSRILTLIDKIIDFCKWLASV